MIRSSCSILLTVALMTASTVSVAAAQSGADDDAAVYFKDLLRLDPAWADPAILDTLDWPEELESALLRFF